MHARLGEVSLMAATSGPEGSPKHYAEAVKRFCRSIELCDDYLRGYYGLKLVSNFLGHWERQSDETRRAKDENGKEEERKTLGPMCALSVLTRRLGHR